MDRDLPGPHILVLHAIGPVALQHGWRSVKASEAASRAVASLDAGSHKTALRMAWEAVSLGTLEHNEQPIATALKVAESLVVNGDRKLSKDASHLARYCRALLSGVGGGVNAPPIVVRLIRRARSGESQ